MIEGKIKVKSGTEIDSFTKTGLRFKDGTELPADAIILATGYVLIDVLSLYFYLCQQICASDTGI